jgi:hypothetical protein
MVEKQKMFFCSVAKKWRHLLVAFYNAKQLGKSTDSFCIFRLIGIEQKSI